MQVILQGLGQGFVSAGIPSVVSWRHSDKINVKYINAVQFKVDNNKVKIKSKILNVRSSDPIRSVSVCTGLLGIALGDCAFHCQGQHHRPNCCFQTGGLLWLDVACLCKPGWVWKIVAWSLLF